MKYIAVAFKWIVLACLIVFPVIIIAHIMGFSFIEDEQIIGFMCVGFIVLLSLTFLFYMMRSSG